MPVSSKSKQLLRSLGLGLLAWTAFGVFFGLQGYVNAKFFGQPASLPPMVAVWLVCGYAWMLLTPAAVFLAGRFPLERGKIARHLPVHFAAAALFPLAHLSLYITVMQVFTGHAGEWLLWWKAFVRIFFSDYQFDFLVYWAIVGLVHLREINRRYLERQRESMRLAVEAAQLETRLAQVRLDALKMQIHPHFLFNTLNSISVLMRDDAEAANRMLLRLSELLRVALKSESAQEVKLRDELEFLRGYLEIEQTRFQDRLTVDFAVEEATLDARIPNLILQPLVENAIRHGITPRAEAGRISVKTRRLNGFVELSVTDNGVGLGQEPAMNGGIGLSNTRERLERLYGEKQQFAIVAPAGGGFQVSIKLPFHTVDADE